MPYAVCKKTLIIESYKSQKPTKEEKSQPYMLLYALCGSQKQLIESNKFIKRRIFNKFVILLFFQELFTFKH